MEVKHIHGKMIKTDTMKRIFFLVLMISGLSSYGQLKPFSAITPGPVSSGTQVMTVKDSGSAKYDRLVDIADLGTYINGLAQTTLQEVIENGKTSSNPAFFTDVAGKRMVGIGGFANFYGVGVGLLDDILTATGDRQAGFIDSLGPVFARRTPSSTSILRLVVHRDSLYSGTTTYDTLQTKGGIIALLSDIAAAATQSLQGVCNINDTTTTDINIKSNTTGLHVGLSSSTESVIKAGLITTNKSSGGRITLEAPGILIENVSGTDVMQIGEYNGIPSVIFNDKSGKFDTVMSAPHAANQRKVIPYTNAVDTFAMLSQIRPLHAAGTPTLAFGAGAGTGATGGLLGSDAGGIINFSSGTTPAIGTVLTVTFHTAYSSAPYVIVVQNDGSTSFLGLLTNNITTTNFRVEVLTPIPASSVYTWKYIVIPSL